MWSKLVVLVGVCVVSVAAHAGSCRLVSRVGTNAPKQLQKNYMPKKYAVATWQDCAQLGRQEADAISSLYVVDKSTGTAWRFQYVQAGFKASAFGKTTKGWFTTKAAE